MVLCPCSYLVHRREELYPDPERFRPERFLERKFGPHEWFPFGGGNRVCLGMPFALYEMKVLLATLLSQVRPSSPGGGTIAGAAVWDRAGAGRRGEGRREQDDSLGSHQSAAKGTGSPASWLRAFIAARCSASFLFRPQAGRSAGGRSGRRS